jgi:hypothetical protein
LTDWAQTIILRVVLGKIKQGGDNEVNSRRSSQNDRNNSHLNDIEEM